MAALVAALDRAGVELWAVSSTNKWVVVEGVRQFGIPESRVLADFAASATQQAPHDFGLSKRELEVLVLIAEGRSNPEIGRQLYITRKTVAVHVSNILAKLEVSGRVEAAAVAIRLGLTERS